jgi:hypothetical protein
VSRDDGVRGNDFNGKVKWVQLDIDAAAKDVNHIGSAVVSQSCIIEIVLR